MTSQGWQPGDHLGVKGAAHAEFHTDANFSHIRVAIKDDNLGLGAKIGSGVGPGECTGLDAFQNLLGRLNGRDEEEMEKEQKSREDLKRAIYAEQRWGTIRFVKGGLLVGDKIQPLIEAEAERVRKLKVGGDSSDSSSEESTDEAAVVVQSSKQSKKRKLEDAVESSAEVVAVKVKKSKKRKVDRETHSADEARTVKKSRSLKRSRTEPNTASEDDEGQANDDKKASKKSKKQKQSGEDGVEDDEKSQRRREKEERKRERRERREKKEQAKQEEDAARGSKATSKKEKKKDKGNLEMDSETSRISTKESTPVVADSSGRSTPMMQGRHAVRARNIAQKRLASMDVASLNQVCYVPFLHCLRY